MSKRQAVLLTILMVAGAVAYVATFGFGGAGAVFILGDALMVVIVCAFFLRREIPAEPVEKPD